MAAKREDDEVEADEAVEAKREFGRGLFAFWSWHHAMETRFLTPTAAIEKAI